MHGVSLVGFCLTISRNVDPFYLKEEFAPSDQEMIKRQQQRMHDSLVPHFRIFQFLESHYQATRLGSQCAEKAYLRLIKISLNGLKRRYKHPLTRELHFHIVLLGITVLRHGVSLDSSSRWRLKDEIISAALAWFASPPMSVTLF